MLRSFYIAGTGMVTQRSKMNVVINNITNMDTSGYKSDQVLTRSFPDLLLDRLNDSSILNSYYVGPQNTGIYVDELSTNFAQGPAEQTDVQTDLMLAGDGFFVVQTPGGVQYTRAGNFTVDSQGILKTQEGFQVLGIGGPINVGTENFTVREDGTVYNAEGALVGTLRIVQFEDNGVLRKMGNNNYVPYNNEQPAAAVGTKVMQGMLEGSNVDSARVVAEMMLTQRVYESSQRMLQMIDSSLEKTVNEIARF